MVAERKRVDRLVKDITSTPEGVPLPSYHYGKRQGAYISMFTYSMLFNSIKVYSKLATY